jgi:hypothetical protein
MIETIAFGTDFTVMIADEPTEQLNQILEIARTDEGHDLHTNYKNINFDDFLFYNLFILNGVAVTFYALQQSAWMPQHAARAYTRYYKHKDFREEKYHLTFAPYMKQMLDYSSYQHWVEKHKISTLFFTRNIHDKKDATRYFARFGWNSYPYICNINNTPQYVLWKGEENLSFLESMHVEKVL